jgi:hypothetical protein
MTEKELTLLGLEKQEIEDYVGEENPDYYYFIKIVNGLDFITNTKQECENDEWYVEFFDTEPSIRFTKFGEVQSLFNLLNKKIIK